MAVALKLPETEEGISYGTSGVKRQKKLMFRLKEDGRSVAVKLDWLSHDRLLAAHPAVLFKTPQYEGSPAFLVRLELLSLELATELIDLSWKDAPISTITLRG